MNYDQPLKLIPFDRFNLEESEEYKKHLKPGNALVFKNSAELLSEVMDWLEAEFPGGGVAAGLGKDHLANAVIVTPKINAEINKDFSKNVQESQLAKKKSKLGPQ